MGEVMKIYIVRHGEDNNNYRGGWSDLPLIDIGIKQSEKLALFLESKKKEFDIRKIISSDLNRAKQTADIINNKLKVKIEYTYKLREMNNGRLAGMENKEATIKYPGIYFNTLDMNERFPDGESPIEFYNRIISGFENIINENKKYENILIVTHGGVINIIYRYINNIKWSNKIKPIKAYNASLFSLVINENKRFFELENYNEFLR